MGDGFSYGLDMAGGHLLDCTYASYCDGAAPGELTDADVADLGAQADARETFKLEFDGRAYARLAAAPLLGRLRRGLLEDGVSFSLQSAHDTSVMPLLVALGAGDGKWAPYASAVVLETWRKPSTGDAFVRAAYDGAPLVLDGCRGEALCALADFRAATAWADGDRDCGAATAPTLVVDAGGGDGLWPRVLWNAACFLAGAAAVHAATRARRPPAAPKGFAGLA